MNEQAALLRSLVAERKPGAAFASNRPPVLVIGSGKGGVGKSVVGIALAACSAEAGRRVLLVDGAQNFGNLHVLLGVRPRASLADLLLGVASVEELLTPVVEGLTLIPADSGTEALQALGGVERARLHHRLTALYDGFDLVVSDTEPGADSVLRACTLNASRLVMVTVPEPAALTDAYAVIKLVHLEVRRLPIGVVVNRATSELDGLSAFNKLAAAAERFLGRTLDLDGVVPEDASLRAAARQPGGLLTAAARGPAMEALTRIATHLRHADTLVAEATS